MVEQITVKVFRRRCKAQGASAREHVAFVCVVCGTVQSMASLMKAGASPERVESLVGFSCEGRLTNAGSWPRAGDRSVKASKRRKIRGCDWTLGGLFKIHQLEVVDDDKPHPRFTFATPEQARTLESAMEQTP